MSLRYLHLFNNSHEIFHEKSEIALGGILNVHFLNLTFITLGPIFNPQMYSIYSIQIFVMMILLKTLKQFHFLEINVKMCWSF